MGLYVKICSDHGAIKHEEPLMIDTPYCPYCECDRLTKEIEAFDKAGAIVAKRCCELTEENEALKAECDRLKKDIKQLESEFVIY